MVYLYTKEISDRMKRIFQIGTLIAAAELMMTSCDSVSEPDRFIPAEINPQRSLLVEEFTGQNCTNCPDGHKAIKDITESLGDSVVAVCIHASGLAFDAPRGYKTATGEEYYKNAGSPTLPTAVINLQTAPLQVSAWGAQINRLIMTPTPFTVKAATEISADNMDISVAFSSGEDYEGKLMVWVCENNLVGIQLDHGTWVRDYDHNHVFRAAATPDIWGDDVNMKSHVAQNKSYTVPIDPSWNKDNLYVVAFLYNGDGVAQVTQTH